MAIKHFRYSVLTAALTLALSGQSHSLPVTDLTLMPGVDNLDINGFNYNSVTILSPGLTSMLDSGISNNVSVLLLTNKASYIVDGTGLSNSNFIQTLDNQGGIISNYGVSIYNSFGSHIGELKNSGVVGVGEEEGSAIINNGTIDRISNSGTIMGDIYSSSGLIIDGGSGTTIGQLTGYSAGGEPAVGLLRIWQGDVVFSAGNTRLNDNVSIVGGDYSVRNTGANLYVADSIHVLGNYIQSADASLNIEVSPNMLARSAGTLSPRSGTLYVAGATQIAAGSSVNLVSRGYAFAPGQRYVVIDSANGEATNYNENTLHYSAGDFYGRVSGSAISGIEGNKSLVVSLSGPASFVRPPMLLKAPSLLGLLRYSGISNIPLLELQNSALAINTQQEANMAGMQLSATTQLNAMMASMQSMATQMNQVIARLQSLAGTLNVPPAASGFSGGDDPAEHSVWGQTFGGRINQGKTSEVSGYYANYAGVIIGADTDITENWRGGGALSYTGTSVHGNDYTTGSDSDIDSYGLTFYAGYTAPTWYSNVYLGAASQRYHTQRRIAFTGFSGDASGRFSGEQYMANVEVGYPIKMTTALVFTPMASLSYSYQSQDSYTESGGNGAALKVDKNHNDATTSGLGAKLEGIIATRMGELNPYLQVMWYHQYDSKPARTSAGFAAASDETAFISRGNTPAKDVADINVGMSLIHTRDTELKAYYGISAASHYSNQSVGLSFRKWF